MQVFLEHMGYSVELPMGETVFGRDVGCGVRLQHVGVSRRHMRFVRRTEVVALEDLGSTNGTLVNGRMIVRPVQLADGDEIEVSGRVFRIKFVHEGTLQQSTRRLTQLSDLARIAARTRSGRSNRATTEDDRRRSTRRDAVMRVVYTSPELELDATTLDLSRFGVFICTEVLDAIGTKCTMTVQVTGSDPLRINGVVKRVVERDSEGHPAGLAIEFVDLGARQRQWIESAVAWLDNTDVRDRVEDP